MHRSALLTELMDRVCGQGFEVTLSDLVVATGLPGYRIQEAVRRLAGDCSVSYRVTESGEILYKFAPGQSEVPRVSNPAVGLAEGVRRAATSFSRWMRERWPLLLLGGYFTLFLALPFPPALILLAVLLSTWSDLSYFDSYGRPRAIPRRGTPPLSNTLHRYLFAGGGRRTSTKRERVLDSLSFVRSHKGFVSLSEVMVQTGQSVEDARRYLDELVVAFSGEPTVTKSGGVIYNFPSLMKSVTAMRGKEFSSLPTARKNLPMTEPSETDRRKTRIISLVNFTNLFFAVYYGSISLGYMTGDGSVESVGAHLHSGASLLFNAAYSLMLGAHVLSALPAMFLVLGVFPFSIASMFFALHRHAAHREVVARREASESSLRRAVYAQVFSHPGTVDPHEIAGSGRRVGATAPSEESVARVLDELAAVFDGEIEESEEGRYVYHFPELENEIEDVEKLRAMTDLSIYDVGRVVFDSRTWPE